MKLNKPSKPSGNVNRAYAVASCIGATLKASPNPTPELVRVERQVNRMMKVYSRKVGRKHYWKTSALVEKVWIELADKYSNVIHEDSINVLSLTIGHLLNEQTYKEVLAIPQPGIPDDVDSEDFRKICESTLRLNDEFNRIFGTKSAIYSIYKPKMKEPKKERPKIKSKGQIKHEDEVKEHKMSNQRKKEFFAKLRTDKTARELKAKQDAYDASRG